MKYRAFDLGRVTLFLFVIFAENTWAETFEAPLDIRKSTSIKFAAEPKVLAAGDKWTVSFSLSVASDVEVAIVDEKNTVLRHLAAGLLGPNAPTPFKKDALAQEVIWDGKDDLGKAVTGPCSVRVTAGTTPKLDKLTGYEANNVPWIASITVGKNGELYVMSSNSYRGETGLRVFDRDGKYLRTLIPYSANTPKERLTTIGQLEIDGERLPLLLNGVVRSIYPLINGMRHQNAVFTSKGQLVMVSAIGTLAEQGSPRNLLAFHPEGGAPEGVSFVGPPLRGPGGFIGGCGEAALKIFDNVTANPSGDTFYVSVNQYSRLSWEKKAVNGVRKMTWSDKVPTPLFLGKDEAGSDDEHFNTPTGLACDAKGNLYVCDWGNNRVMVFSPESKLLGKFAVNQPTQIAVHPTTGEIYICSCMTQMDYGRYWKEDVILRKFSAFEKGEPKELVNTAIKGVDLMALDSTAMPARLWISGSKGLCPVMEKSGQFELGASILSKNGVEMPWYLAADSARNKIYYYERLTHPYKPKIFQLDTESGVCKEFKNGVEPAVDLDGNVYVYNGFDTIERFDPSGKPLPFSSIGTHKLKTKGARCFGPNLGMPGFSISPHGEIYILRSNSYGNGDAYGCRLDVYDTTGKLIKENLIDGMAFADCCVGADALGNIYVGSNTKPAERPFPAAFMGKIPAKPWGFWEKSKRVAPWDTPYLNAYLFYWGSVFKFAPEGGAFYGFHPWNLKDPKYVQKSTDSLANAPKDAVSYRSAQLNYEVKVKGALWRYPGFGMIAGSMDGMGGDAACSCHNSRFAVDPYGRVFLPNPFEFSVEMTDTNGNQIARIGRYGNADSGGAGSKIPEPAIPFGCPTSVSVSGDKVFVSDSLNRRFVIIKLTHEAELICKIR